MQNPLQQVGSYLSEAVQRIFTPLRQRDEPQFAVTPFEGRIAHHKPSGLRFHHDPVGDMPPEQHQGSDTRHLSQLRDAVVDAIEHAMATDVEQGGADLQGRIVRHRRDIRHRH